MLAITMKRVGFTGLAVGVHILFCIRSKNSGKEIVRYGFTSIDAFTECDLIYYVENMNDCRYNELLKQAKAEKEQNYARLTEKSRDYV